MMIGNLETAVAWAPLSYLCIYSETVKIDCEPSRALKASLMSYFDIISQYKTQYFMK